jgi:ABC-type dipeptide/oligopeptide/nickel transport system permease subunit
MPAAVSVVLFVLAFFSALFGLALLVGGKVPHGLVLLALGLFGLVQMWRQARQQTRADAT